MIERLVWFASGGPGAARSLLERVRALPQEPRPASVPAPRSPRRYPPCAGGLLVSLGRNRRLAWPGIAKSLFLLTDAGGWSAPTIGQLGLGAVEVSPVVHAGFATVLGIPIGDLSAMTGIDLADGPPGGGPTSPR